MLCGAAWATSFMLTKTFEDMRSAWGEAGAFWFFAGCNVAGLVFFVVALVETKGKSYDQIQAHFRRHGSTGDSCQSIVSSDALK